MEQAGEYAPMLKVTFIPGRTPELFLRDDDGQELEEPINLTALTTEEIHALMAAKGVVRSAAPTHSEEL